MKMNSKPLKNKYSLSRENNSLVIRGKYFIYSPLGLTRVNGEAYIPIKDIEDVGVAKVKSSRNRTVAIVLGIVIVIFNKIFDKWIFKLLDFEALDRIKTLLIGAWAISILCYLISRKTLLEISTKDTRYCVSKKNTKLEELISLIRL